MLHIQTKALYSSALRIPCFWLATGLLLLLLAAFPVTALAGPDNADVFQTLRCDFEDVVSRFSIEADMTDFDKFTNKVHFFGGGESTTYSLKQQQAANNEIFRLLLNGDDPKNSVRIQVWDSVEAGIEAIATFIEGKAPNNVVEGKCYYY